MPNSILGGALSCMGGQSPSLVLIDSVPYGAKGPFSINFWFHMVDSAG